MNFDGGFGSKPGSESHAGLIYCCVGFLSITRKLLCKNLDIKIDFTFSYNKALYFRTIASY